MKNPLISVCVICFNQERYIADCLNSIVRQVCDFSYEVVIGDDCSTDSTRQIIEDFEKRYPNIVRCLPSERNLGIVPNFLRTAKACKGNFIAFCEGDDYWIDSRKLEIEFTHLSKRTDIDIAFHPAILKHQSGKASDSVQSYYGNKRTTLKLDDIIVGRGNIIPSASIMFKKSIFDTLPTWFHEMDGCDFFLKIIASVKGGAMYIPNIMSVYRYQSIGSWSSQYSKDKLHQIKQIEKMCGFVNKLETHIKEISQIKISFLPLRIDYIAQLLSIDQIENNHKHSVLKQFKGHVPAIIYYFAYSALVFRIARGVFYFIKKINRLRIHWLKLKGCIGLCR